VERAVLETASDRYVILEYLAEGGMGAIYLGKKLGVDGFEKEVVLKQLLPELTRQQRFIDLFLREARISASLDHANIVRTVDLVHTGDDYFMILEYVRGADLRTLLRRAKRRSARFSPAAGLFIAHEILEALHYAHGKTGIDGSPLGLIHRDVSPSNILISGAGEVKLSDFGIAKASSHRSIFYKVKGKVGYMSPEQARGEPVDARSDLFSLAVVLYEVLVGERVYVGDLMSAAAQIYAQKVVPPSKKRKELPAELDDVILKAMALDPERRYQTAEDFQEALHRVATRHRLLCNATEFATQMRALAGDDPASWLKLETLGFDDSQAIHSGTAIVPPDDDDDDDGHEFSRVPSTASRRPGQTLDRPRSLIAPLAARSADVRAPLDDDDDEDETTKAKDVGDSLPLSPLRPQKSEKNATSTAAKRGGLYDDDVETAARLPPADSDGTEVPDEGETFVRPPSPTVSPARSRADSGALGPGFGTPEDQLEEEERWDRASRSANPSTRAAALTGGRCAGVRRIWPAAVVLGAIGVGVAAVVALGGPEVEVVDPVIPPSVSVATPPPAVPLAAVAAPTTPAPPSSSATLPAPSTTAPTATTATPTSTPTSTPTPTPAPAPPAAAHPATPPPTAASPSPSAPPSRPRPLKRDSKRDASIAPPKPKAAASPVQKPSAKPAAKPVKLFPTPLR
jgi:serine/threonine protein kinase